MADFQTMRLPPRPDAVAPDGSYVRVLLQLAGGSMAHFELGPRQTSTAVTHQSVEEIWLVLSGAERCGAGRAIARRSCRLGPASA